MECRHFCVFIPDSHGDSMVETVGCIMFIPKIWMNPLGSQHKRKGRFPNPAVPTVPVIVPPRSGAHSASFQWHLGSGYSSGPHSGPCSGPQVDPCSKCFEVIVSVLIPFLVVAIVEVMVPVLVLVAILVLVRVMVCRCWAGEQLAHGQVYQHHCPSM